MANQSTGTQDNWAPLSADGAILQAQSMSEIDTVSDTSEGQQYRIFFRRFDSPSELRLLGKVSSKKEADMLKFWVEAEEVLCLMGCKREVSEAVADMFRDVIYLGGKHPTLVEVIERGKKVDRMYLHPESSLKIS